MPKELKLEDIKRVSDRFIQNCVTLREQKMISHPNLIKYLLGLGIDINKLFK